MGQTLSKAGPTVNVAEIVHHGEKLILPEGLSIEGAMKLLQRRQDYLQEDTKISETFNVFPWDGAHALNVVLEQRYGWSPATPTPGFFGPEPPQMISIEIGFAKTTQIPWGRFALPNIKGFIQTGVGQKDGRLVFAITAVVKRESESVIQNLFADMREYLKENSIYRGQAVKIRFLDENGDKLQMPEPKFMDLDSIDESLLVYPEAVQKDIETNLFTPIDRVDDCIKNGMSVKRGILLGGTYGTGKTLAAFVAAKHASRAKATFVYVPRGDELAEAIEFAKMYQQNGCVVFCEDIDRVVSGERSVAMDDILNIIDGIDTKSARIITVLTTNHLDKINPAMLRPGRLDSVIEILPPDAKAVELLLRKYGGEAIGADVDLTEAGVHLDGEIPAVIAEVIKRAKLVQLKLQEPGTIVRGLTGAAVVEAARSMKSQLDLLARRINTKTEKPRLVEALSDVIRRVINGDEVETVEVRQIEADA